MRKGIKFNKLIKDESNLKKEGIINKRGMDE